MTDQFMAAAMEEAKIGLREGGIPIGAALVIENRIVGRGRNERIQKGDPIAHAEMACLRNAGRLSAFEYRKAALYTTLSPCDMCGGAILLYKIPLVIMSENVNFQGPEDYLRSRGVQIINLCNQECIDMMTDFIEKNPELWNEDIGSCFLR